MIPEGDKNAANTYLEEEHFQGQRRASNEGSDMKLGNGKEASVDGAG